MMRLWRQCNLADASGYVVKPPPSTHLTRAVGGSAHPFADLFDRALRTGPESADVHIKLTSANGTRRTQRYSPGLIPIPCVAGSNPAGGATNELVRGPHAPGSPLRLPLAQGRQTRTRLWPQRLRPPMMRRCPDPRCLRCEVRTSFAQQLFNLLQPRTVPRPGTASTTGLTNRTRRV
jgi:hypothetical protein